MVDFYQEDKIIYHIGLDLIYNSGKILDSIFQINQKCWCDEKYIRGYLEVLENLTKVYFDNNAQGVFCPFGELMKIDWEQKTYSEIFYKDKKK